MTTNHNNLGQVVAEVMATIHGWSNDPISREYGFYPDVKPELRRILRDNGFDSEEDFTGEVSRRTSPRWLYQSGISVLLD